MREFLNEIKIYFIRGLAIIFPVFVTIIIFKWVIVKINLWFLEPFVRFLRPYIDSFILMVLIKVIVFFLILLFIILCGMFARLIFMRRFFVWGEGLLQKTPVIRKIYLATKEISAALFGQKKGLFKRVVLVEYPRQGLFAVGFITADNIDKKVVKRPLQDDLVSVFIPTTPNPTTGVFVFMEKKDTIDVDMTVEEAVKLILSGGAITPYR